MPRLPQPGADAGNWGEILNEYLSQSLASDGSLKTDSVSAAQLKSNSVTNAAIVDATITGNKIADNTIPVTKLQSIGEADGIATLDDSARLSESQIPERLAESELAVSYVGFGSLFSGRVVLFIGDSITNGSNASNASTHAYPAVVQQIAGSAAVIAVVSGHPGERADQIVTYLADALSANPTVQHVHVQVGTNDSAQARTLMQFQTAIIEFERIARATGKTISFGLVPPKPASATAIDALLRLYNLWLSQWARQSGHLVADTFGALADPITGYFRADYDDDGTHPNNAGHLAMARAIAPVVVGKAVLYVPRDFLISPLGLVANPLMSDTTGWVVRSGSVTSRSIVLSEPGDGLKFGKWHRITKDNSAGSSAATVIVAHDLDSSKFSPGDVLLVHGRINHQGTTGGATNISLVNGAAAVAYPGRAPVEVTIPGEILRTVTVPVSFTTLRIGHQVTVPAGGVIDSHLGECQVINLTTGGLINAF